jgi:CheY-like chemotaxis protein
MQLKIMIDHRGRRHVHEYGGASRPRRQCRWRAAAQRIATEKFDLVALAAEMPSPDGFELARQVRESPSNHGVPILMFTAPENSEAMRGFGGVTFMENLNREARGCSPARGGAPAAAQLRAAPVRVEVRAGRGGQFQTHSLDLSQGGILLESSGG